MPRYSFRCTSCAKELELTMKMSQVPSVGGVATASDTTEFKQCDCGCFTFTRLMETKGSAFKLNFRGTSV